MSDSTPDRARATTEGSRPLDRLRDIDRNAILNSSALFGKQREVVIAHAGQSYRLRITQNNKLILTK